MAVDRVPMGSCVSETVNNIESITGKSFLLFITFYRNSSAVFAWAASKVNEAELLKFLEISNFKRV